MTCTRSIIQSHGTIYTSEAAFVTAKNIQNYTCD
jgi:hypothetical protein